MSAAGGHVDAVRLLLNRNASPVMLNSYKKSALDMALDYEQVDAAVTMMKHKKYEQSHSYTLYSKKLNCILTLNLLNFLNSVILLPFSEHSIIILVLSI